MQAIFTSIYENKHWGDNEAEQYAGSSGTGSSVEANLLTYAPFLRAFIKLNNIKSVVDCGCGDWRCGPVFYNNLPITYTGIDAYDKLIEAHKVVHSQHTWMCMDFFGKKEEIPSADLLILKDVIQHWKTAEIYEFLDHITASKKFKYILIVNCCNQTIDDYDIPKIIEDTYRWRPLSANYFPLKKYKPDILFKFNTKEVSVIETSLDT